MKLYYSPGSSSMAIHILLEEIGKPYELELVSTKDKQTQSPEYLALNPKGRVPMLEISPDLRLTELPAISFYLAKTNPAVELLPSDHLLQARCLEWFNWLSGTVHTVAFGLVWRSARFVHNEALFPELVKKGTENILDHFAYIEHQLSKNSHTWAVGEDFSVVDPYLLVLYYWGHRINLDMQPYPNWTKHTKKMLQRNTVQSVLKQEGIEIVA